MVLTGPAVLTGVVLSVCVRGLPAQSKRGRRIGGTASAALATLVAFGLTRAMPTGTFSARAALARHESAWVKAIVAKKRIKGKAIFFMRPYKRFMFSAVI